MRHTLVAALVSIALFFMSAPAHAARVSPMIVELQPNGGGSTARVELTNDADRDIPFEARVMRGEINETGDLTLTPADEDFLVFPVQTVVQRKSQQVFRVQYVGEPDLAKSAIYYLSIQQVPVQFEPGKSQVQVVVNYNILVNVVPKAGKPVAMVVSALPTVRELPQEPAPAADPAAAPAASIPSDAPTLADDEAPAATPATIKQPGLTVRLSNVGTRYFLAGMSRWDITGTAEDGSPFSRSYRAEDMTKIIGVGVVGPDRIRQFFVPTGVSLVAGSVQIKVSP